MAGAGWASLSFSSAAQLAVFHLATAEEITAAG
jgi:hypothetical protein